MNSMELKEGENAFMIKTPVFEGPFALLLSLVENKKLFINDLSLAQVTEEYLGYINNMPSAEYESQIKQTEQISGFIVVAATLLLIKSKSLLPNLDLTTEEEEDIHNLEDRLKQYKIYSELGINIKEMFGESIIFTAEPSKDKTVVFLPDDRITKEFMMELVQEVFTRIPKKVTLVEVEVKKVISIEEMIDKLTTRMQNSINMNFSDFTGIARTKEERIVVIVGFLAMLELARTGILNLVQENNFGDIFIEKQDNTSIV